MSWILNDEEGILYAEAEALGASNITLQSKARVEKFIQTKFSLQTQSTADSVLRKLEEISSKQEEISSKQEEIRCEMIAKQEEISSKQEDTDRKIAAMTEKFASVNLTDANITPSETCSTKHSTDFTLVLDWLKLDASPNFINRVSLQNFAPSSFSSYTKYRWDSGNESDGYEVLCVHLTTNCNLIAKNVSSGKDLPGQVLYDENVYSLRDRVVDGLTLRAENRIPIHRFRIRGRTDIVVLDDNILGKSHVKFAVEVKTVEGMKQEADENQSLREAFLQLIGLNVGNCYKSPAVVLTDMHSKHYVLYLEKVGDPELSLKVSLKIHKSAELNEILHFANELSTRTSFTGRLGTILTPPPSDRDDQESFGNVEITNIDDVEGLDDI